MITTEREAEGKRCPFPVGLNFDCRASKCMAWRWKYAPLSREEIVIRKDRLIDLGIHHDAAVEQAVHEAKGTGFCGLAGRP